jgi:undecaprenyl-diphosphatase
VFSSINRFAARTGWAHQFMKLYTNEGIVLFAVLVLFGYVISRRRLDIEGEAAALSAGCSAAIALGIAQLVGDWVHRGRPFDTLTDVHVLVGKAADPSFPSQHATAAGAVAVGLLFGARLLGLIAGGAAVLMAFSRVYVGVHYPGDVLAGLVLGGAVAVLAQVMLVPIVRRVLRITGDSRLRWLVLTSGARWSRAIGR